MSDVEEWRSFYCSRILRITKFARSYCCKVELNNFAAVSIYCNFLKFVLINMEKHIVFFERYPSNHLFRILRCWLITNTNNNNNSNNNADVFYLRYLLNKQKISINIHRLNSMQSIQSLTNFKAICVCFRFFSNDLC